jgi:hypothetical protein
MTTTITFINQTPEPMVYAVGDDTVFSIDAYGTGKIPLGPDGTKGAFVIGGCGGSRGPGGYFWIWDIDYKLWVQKAGRSEEVLIQMHGTGIIPLEITYDIAGNLTGRQLAVAADATSSVLPPGGGPMLEPIVSRNHNPRP